MLKRVKRANWVVLLALTAALSCTSDSRGPTTPAEPQLEPQAGLLDGLFRWRRPPPQPDYTYIQERPLLDLSTLQVSSVLGILGGTLELAGHVLEVPRGAVEGPTLFTLIVLPTGRVEVEIFAVQSLLGRLLNLGSRGFERPVPLTLTYSRATNVTDPSRLKILRIKADGQHEILPSTVDTQRKTVTAQLDHFSRYCMISD